MRHSVAAPGRPSLYYRVALFSKRAVHHVLPRILLVVLGVVGCAGGDANDRCVKDLDLQCAPLYTPDFDEIFTRTLQPTCAVSGGACHAASGGQGGMVLDEIEGAYAALQDRVKPGDPGCSPLVRRLEAGDAGSVMPPGDPLLESERCVFVRWIDAGAPR